MRRRILAGGLLAAGFAVMAGLVLAPGLGGHAAAAEKDGPGPNLVIAVAGQTKGEVVIDLAQDVAPRHVERIVALARAGDYDGVVVHRVIEGFLAQTGDVEFGRRGGDTARAGMGGSQQPDLKAEFSNRPFRRGTVGMARSASPDSANSQFFIMFDDAPHLDGQYTVVGHVVSGMDVVDAIKRGSSSRNGSVSDPDYMAKVTVQP